MLNEYVDKLDQVREDTADVLNALMLSQKLVLMALENCDQASYDQAFVPTKGLTEKIEKIDTDILIVFARYTPEAKDLREMIAFLKITSSLLRIVNNSKNYLEHVEICSPKADEETKKIIVDSLAINRCTIKALEYTIAMAREIEDKDKLLEYASKIAVEASKTDDIYALIEKEMLQKMNKEHLLKEEHFNLLKYIRKNLKVTDRLEEISARLKFARIGGMTL